MLLNIKIRNFRSIKDQVALDLQATNDTAMKSSSVFEIDDIAILKTAGIYGSNASGKTNTLKALSILRMMVLESFLRSTLPISLPSEHFKLSTATENLPSYFEITFLLNSKIFIYGFEIDKKKICSEWLNQKKGNKKLFKRELQKLTYKNKNYFPEASDELMKHTDERTLLLTRLASNESELSKQIIKWFQSINIIFGANRGDALNFSFGQFMTNSELSKDMKEFVVKADFGIVDIQASEKMVSVKEVQNMPDKFKELFFNQASQVAERKLKFLHKKYDESGTELEPESFDFFTEESEGTQQFFVLSAPVLDALKNGKILIVDEINASMHPILSQYLVSLFNSKEKNPNNAQLIFTSHDVSLLDQELLRRDQIYFAQKNKKGATELFSLADISERKGVDYAKRYLEGRYDAIPYVSDFEDIKFSRQ